MKHLAILSAVTCLLLTACGAPATDAGPATPAAEATADAAPQTEAVYGDEAPVAIEAETAEAHGHPHNADGSHPAAEDPAHGKGEHSHGEGEANHDH